MILIQKRIRTFEKANRTINKQRKIKKTRIQQRKIFNIQNVNTLLNIKEIDTQLEEKIYISGRSRGGDRTIIQCCGNCNEPKYNTRTCKKDKEISNVYNSE